jgi:hypothetical protein
VHNPLPIKGSRPSRHVSSGTLQIENDVLAHAPYLHDSAVLQNGRDFRGRRFQGLRFFSQPDRLNHVPSDPLIESASNGFDFRKFGHKLLVYGGILSLSETHEV